MLPSKHNVKFPECLSQTLLYFYFFNLFSIFFFFFVGNAVFLLGLMLTLDLNWGSNESSTSLSGLPVYMFQLVGLVECLIASAGSAKYAGKDGGTQCYIIAEQSCWFAQWE